MKNSDVSILIRPGQRITAKRRGLAPLEMVLVLPILMMIMSMFIVFGYLASWKLRTENVSRDAIWRDRSDRFSNQRATLPEWPGTIHTESGPWVEEFQLEQVLNDPIIAGPLTGVNVDQNVLYFGRGVREGVARINREPPVFANLASIDFRVENPIIDDQFRYWQMGIGNLSRRIPRIYEIELDFIRSSVAMQNAVSQIDNAPFRSQLDALERDPEFIAWRGSAPDFHPRIRSFCSTEVDTVIATCVNPLLLRIERLPVRMANASIALYREQLRSQPPLPESVQAELRRKIAALEAWIDDLNR